MSEANREIYSHPQCQEGSGGFIQPVEQQTCSTEPLSSLMFPTRLKSAIFRRPASITHYDGAGQASRCRL